MTTEHDYQSCVTLTAVIVVYKPLLIIKLADVEIIMLIDETETKQFCFSSANNFR
jgi:hypothetical protein